MDQGREDNGPRPSDFYNDAVSNVTTRTQKPEAERRLIHL